MQLLSLFTSLVKIFRRLNPVAFQRNKLNNSAAGIDRYFPDERKPIPRYSTGNLYSGNARLPIQPIYMEKEKRKRSRIEERWGAHLRQMRRMRPTLRTLAFCLHRGRERAVVTPDPPAIISFLFTQHIVSGLRVVCRSIRHCFFLPAAVIYLGTEIRFANRAASHCCAPRRKAAFIVIFTFTSRATAPGRVAHWCIDWCIFSFEAIARFRCCPFHKRYIAAFNAR